MQIIFGGQYWNSMKIWWLFMVLQLLFLHSLTQKAHAQILPRNNADTHLPSLGVKLVQQDQYLVMSNGIVSITLTTPGGTVTSVTYKGSDNLLDAGKNEYDRGHWDVLWTKQGRDGVRDNLLGTNYTIIVQNENQTEISFTTRWEVGSSRVPLNVDKRFVMLRDSPGFYTYAVFERLKGWPAFELQNGRVVFKLDENKFQYMAMSDDRQRIMPRAEDRESGKVLDYKEAVLLTNPKNGDLKGEVDDKYFYSCDNKDNKVHGWIGSEPPVGFWMITPSNEFRTGGPFKQDLTSHTGPIVLSVFVSRHYAGEALDVMFQSEEYWKKVIGPLYIHLNSDHDSDSAKANPSVLWDDAKLRMQKEVSSWPYSFPLSHEFIKSKERGAVSGQLLVRDMFINKQAVPAASAFIGLAPQGAVGSWQSESKGYQFWTQTDRSGNFAIESVIPGNYSLFAWVNGTIGDYKHSSDITITPGSNTKVSSVIFEAPRKGDTLWEIGIPDRTAAEFFIPDPSPAFKIHQYPKPIEKFREYGLWARYQELYPQDDLVYKVGTSDYRIDWFFAQVVRNSGNGQYVATTWQILFDLQNVDKAANYTLQLALASATNAELQLRLNDPKSGPYFTTGVIGRDNAVARHGIHGLYYFYSIGIQGSRLVAGKNTIFLTQSRNQGLFCEVMYDYIRLEAPA